MAQGISSAVRLAAWIAAMRAMPITSPLPAWPPAIRASVAGCMRIVPWRAPPVRLGLGRHVDHVGLAMGVEMVSGSVMLGIRPGNNRRTGRCHDSDGVASPRQGTFALARLHPSRPISAFRDLP
jgi:hypothetical protein